MGFLRRFWVVYPLAVVLLAAVGYVGYWFWLAHVIGKGIDDWVAAERARGRDVLIGGRAVTGFPGDLRLAFTDVLYDDPGHERRLHVPALAARLSPFEPDRVSGAFEGPLAVDLGRGPVPGRYIVTAADNDLGYAAGALTVALNGLEIAGPPPVSRAGAATLTVTLTPGTAPVMGSLGIDAQRIQLPAAVGSPLGDTVRYLRAGIDFKGAPLPDAITSAALDDWRRAGGDIEFRTLAFGHGDADVTANGTLALDDALQPIAAFTAKVSAFKESLDTLVAAGMVRAKDAAVAKMVLGFLARTPKGGGKPELGAAISVQDRVLSVGPVNLMRLPEARWD